MGIEGPGNTVGGTTAGAGNLISGNSVDGLQLDSIGYGTNNLIAGNRIGTNAVGTGAVPNAVNGVNLETAETATRSAARAAGAGNLISGKRRSWRLIGGPNRVGGVVEGNQIGTDSRVPTPFPMASVSSSLPAIILSAGRSAPRLT